MGTITTNVPSTNTSASFAAQVSWSLAPAAPALSLSVSGGSSSITASASASTSTGTFSISSVKGTRTGGVNSLSATSQVTVTFTVSDASWSRTKCNVYFNITSSGSNWTNVSSSATTSTGTGKTLKLVTSNTSVGSINNRIFETTVNLGTSYTTQYSLDNVSWQNSGSFSALTPNSTYTVYCRSYSTSSSGNTSSWVYANRSITLGAKPSNLSIRCLDADVNSLTIQVSADNMSSGSYYDLYYAQEDLNDWKVLHLGSSTTTVIDNLDSGVKYKFLLSATNNLGTSYTMSIPNGYKPVEYIQSTGTQYIKTGYKPKGSAILNSRFKFNDTTVQQRVWGNGGTLFNQFYINGSGGFSWALQNNDGNWTPTGVTADTSIHEVVLDGTNNRVMVDGRVTNSITQTHTNDSNYDIYLLQLNNSGSLYGVYSKENMYYFTATENNVLVHYYVPCENDSSVVGMYDILTGTFLQNAGSGTFGKGGYITVENYVFETQSRVKPDVYTGYEPEWRYGQTIIQIGYETVEIGSTYVKDKDGNWVRVDLFD